MCNAHSVDYVIGHYSIAAIGFVCIWHNVYLLVWVAAEGAWLDRLLSVGRHNSLSLKSHHLTEVQHYVKAALMHTGCDFVYW